MHLDRAGRHHQFKRDLLIGEFPLDLLERATGRKHLEMRAGCK